MSSEREDPPPHSSKRPYEPPRIEESGSFERLVLACGHHPTEGGACANPPKGMPRS